jgi:hypothetical protein
MKMNKCGVSLMINPPTNPEAPFLYRASAIHSTKKMLEKGIALWYLNESTAMRAGT